MELPVVVSASEVSVELELPGGKVELPDEVEVELGAWMVVLPDVLEASDSVAVDVSSTGVTHAAVPHRAHAMREARDFRSWARLCGILKSFITDEVTRS